MKRPAAELALPDVASGRLRFNRAAGSFDSASFLHAEARRRLIERLDCLKVEPGILVDVGSGLGQGAAELADIYAGATVIALDSSFDMLTRSAWPANSRVCGDAAKLPFPDRSIDLLFANLVLPWTRPDLLFAEARRVLGPRGVFVFATLGPETLQEIRQAWLRTDDAIHVHAFFDMQTLGDLAVGAGLEEPVLDADRIRVCYQELSGAIRDLRACGATNVAAGRRRGLTGRGRWQSFVEALWRDQGAGERGRLGLTVELILGQAFGASTNRASTAPTETHVPLTAIRGRKPDRS